MIENSISIQSILYILQSIALKSSGTWLELDISLYRERGLEKFSEGKLDLIKFLHKRVVNIKGYKG